MPEAENCAVCGADAAALVASRVMHEAFAGRPRPLVPGVPSDPQWRCVECLEATLTTGSWCAIGLPAATAEPRAAGILVGHGAGTSPWVQLCGLLAAVPERCVVSVCQRPASPGAWLVLLQISSGPDWRDVTERAFEGIAAAVASLTEALEAIVSADARSSGT